MAHQIPPHLAFCTPGQNQKAKQGTNLETLKRKHEKRSERNTPSLGMNNEYGLYEF